MLMLRFSWNTLNWSTYISYHNDVISLFLSSAAAFFQVNPSSVYFPVLQLCYMWVTFYYEGIIDSL